MKQTLLLLNLLLLLTLPLVGLRAQSVGIGIVAPDASAALDIVAADKGLLLPRISESARSTMVAPAAGLIVYQKDGAKPGFWYNAGGTGVLPSPPINWVRLTGSDGVSFDPGTGLQVGPGPVQGNTVIVGILAAGNTSGLPFAGLGTDARTVYLYQAADLAAAGLGAGPISKVELYVSTKASSGPYNNLALNLGLTPASSVSSFPGGLTAVYSSSYSTVAGWNGFALPTPFVWDGSSNLYLEICFDNTTTSLYDRTAMQPVAYTGTYGFVDFANTTAGCALTGGTPPASLLQVPVLRLSQGSAGSYSLPATGGSPGQILVQQTSGGAQWQDPSWQENGPAIFRNQGNVGIGVIKPLGRLSISPNSTEPKITLWDGGNPAQHYGFGVSSGQLNYHVDGAVSSHVFWQGGRNADGTELMRLRGNGNLTIGGTGQGDTRVEIVNDGGGAGGADDVVVRSFGASGGPGLSLQRARGSQAAPENLQRNDLLGDIGFGGRVSNLAAPGFNLSGMRSFYRGNGLTFATDLWFKTSGNASMALDSVGRLGVGTLTPAYRLDVSGTIHAVTGQGIVLDAQDRPLITRAWDVFTSGAYTGLGRWGLFMEPYNLTFGVPVLVGRDFQWATYNLDSSIGSQLMTLNQGGYLGLTNSTPGSRLDIVSDNLGGNGSDDITVRSYGPSGNPGLGLRRYRGTRAAPQNLQDGDFLGAFGLSGYFNGNENFFTLSGFEGYYRGDGSTQLSDLRVYTGGLERMRLDENGRVGIGLPAPQHPLHVNGAIAATTNKGVILDAQDRPLITRGFDAFTSGNYAGLGRWGLFMEPSSLTFGLPALTGPFGQRFQWATYDDNSLVSQQLMTLNNTGYLALGNLGADGPAARIDLIADNLPGGFADDILIRAYGAGATPAMNMRRYRGTRTAPANLQNGDLLGSYGLTGYINGLETPYGLSGIEGYYRGSGTTPLTDLRLVTSGLVRMHLDETGNVGINNVLPGYRLDVNGDVNSTTVYRAAGSPALYYGPNGPVGQSPNLFVGTGSLNGLAATGYYNTTVGNKTGLLLGTGDHNVAVGAEAAYSLQTGTNNVLVGTTAGYNNTSGSRLTALGSAALQNSVASGNASNTGVGYSAGLAVNSGSNNTFLGAGADLASGTQRSNATALGYNAKVDADNALVLGDNTVNVGIGLSAPTHRLHVATSVIGGQAVHAESSYLGTNDGRGVFGRAVNNPGYGYGGYFEGGYYGVWADGQGGNYSGEAWGVRGSSSGTAGIRYGVYGTAGGGTTAYGIYGTALGAAVNYAGYFQGNVHVNGTLSKSAGTFRIDHPQDPANKYLVHSFVESPDMMNVYNGNATTDAQGQAVVNLPAYFEAENKDFKYQLTVIGQFAQAIIAEKVRNNQFVIRTDKPGVEVSWQVTGVRNDLYAQQHRIVPEPAKTGTEQGRYLNPELYGRPSAEGIGSPAPEPAAKQARRR
jgi:hypothetical protein